MTSFEKRALPGRATKIVLITIASVLMVLATLRLLLPWAGLKLVNDRLAELDGFSGRIESANLRVLKGGFTLRDAVVRQDEGADGNLRVEAERIDVSFSWIQLARGRFAGEIAVTRPVVFYAAGAKKETPEKERRKWREVLAASPRFDVTRLEIVEGAARLEWPAGEMTQALDFEQVRVSMTELNNRPAASGAPWATAIIEAVVEGRGVLEAEASGAPMASPPVVEAWVRVKGVELTRLNPLLFAALKVDAAAGTLEMEAEFRAAEGYYEGQVKPFVHGAEFSRSGEGGSFMQGVKEMALDAAATLLANNDTERVASEVPFSGEFGEGEVDVWNAFVTLLGNAVGEALRMGAAGNE